MSPWWQTITPMEWAIAGVVLLLLEAFAPGAFLIWFGIAALILALAVWLIPALPWEVQILSFSILSIGALVGFRAWRKRHPARETEQPLLNKRSEQLVGRLFALDQAIENGRGKIKVGDALWTVTGPELGVGARVRVIAVREQILEVEAA